MVINAVDFGVPNTGWDHRVHANATAYRTRLFFHDTRKGHASVCALMSCSPTPTCYCVVLQETRREPIERVDAIFYRITKPIDTAVSGARALVAMNAVAFGVWDMD